MGDLQTDIGGTGDRSDIGQMPAWCVDALTKATSDGRRKMRENSLYYHTAWYLGLRRYSGSPSAGSLGLPPQYDNGTTYRINTNYAGTTIVYPSTGFVGNGGSWSPWDGDNGHQPEPHLAPYLYFGRLSYLERFQDEVFYYGSVSADTVASGSGINQTPLGDASLVLRGDAPFGNTLQQRAEAWTFRDLVLAALLTPDATNANIYNAKSVYSTVISNTWLRAAFVQATYTNGTGVEDYFDTDGPRYVGYRFNNNVDYGPWQTRYWDWASNTATDLGFNNASSSAFLTWMSVGYIGLSQSPDVAPDYASTGYFEARCAVRGVTNVFDAPEKIVAVQSWADSYQAWMSWPPHKEASVGRTPATITASATSGSSVTITLTGSPLGQTSWYAGGGSILGGWVYETDPAGGRGQIQSVSNANTCVISTNVTGGQSFTTTSLVAGSCRIPMPHPLDAGADGSLTGRDTVYMQLYRLAGILYADRGISTAPCVSYITTSTGYPATMLNKLNINSR